METDDVAHHHVGPFLNSRTFLVEAFRIPTGSMESTLQLGDFLLVNKAVHGARVPFARAQTPVAVTPERGYVVVLLPPHEPAGNNVKRFTGMTGGTLELRDIVPFPNGRAWNEGHARFNDPVNMDSFHSLSRRAARWLSRSCLSRTGDARSDVSGLA